MSVALYGHAACNGHIRTDQVAEIRHDALS